MKNSTSAAKNGKVDQIEIAIPELRPAKLLKVNVSADEAKIIEERTEPMK